MVLLGGVDPEVPAELAAALGPHPVVTGPVVDSLADVQRSAAAALTGYRACAGWVGVPPVVEADALLPERALAGDAAAKRDLVAQIYEPLAEAGNAVLETVQTYLDAGGSLEATARSLFVHANTVRYRLKRVLEITGLQPLDARDAYILRVALTCGRLESL